MIEVSAYPASNGLGVGLNKGLKVGKFLKKNVRMRNVSLKNAVKVGKFALPIATSIIPGGTIASKGLSLLSKVGKVGRFATKIAGSQTVKSVVKFANNPAVKQFVPTVAINEGMPATTTDYGSSEANMDAPIIQQGGQAVNAIPLEQPLATTQGTMIPVKEAGTGGGGGGESQTAGSGLNTQTKNNTMLYVGGGIALLGIIYLATKKK